MSAGGTLDCERLQRLLGRPETRRLVERLRRRLERGGGAAVTLTRASEEERRAVETLLGRPARAGRSLRVPLAALEATLQRAGIAPDLRSALEALGGPLVDRQAVAEAEQERWRAVFAAAADEAAALGYVDWLASLEATGLLRRVAQGDPVCAGCLLGEALRVLGALPAGGTPLSALAAETLGDAHALDAGRPVATLVRHALRLAARPPERCREDASPTAGVAPLPAGGARRSDSAVPAPDAAPEEDDRTLWARVGVLVGGDITSTVLALNLPAQSGGATGRMLAALAGAGEPGYLTLRQLVRAPPAWAVAGRAVFVCENPAVVAEAAARLGPASAPLVATWGRPGAAAVTLLEQLAAAGARLHLRADLDWAGIAIANRLHARVPASPWRMDSATLTAHRHLPGRPLTGTPVTATWDPTLAEALNERGEALEEEQLLDELVTDLAAARTPGYGARNQ